LQQLSGGYGTAATSWTLVDASQITAGETYRVAVSQVSGAADFTYDVAVVSCP
jgi:hypothetical protein